MIALCAIHHAQAGAWTGDQLRKMKSQPADRPEVQGRFQWMREDVLAVVGGNLFYETPNIVVFRGDPMIWFERDDDNQLLLNLRVLTASGQPRTRLMNNDWFIRGDPLESRVHPMVHAFVFAMKMVTTLRSDFVSGPNPRTLRQYFPELRP